MGSIRTNLRSFAEDEGTQAALSKAEGWRNTIEEIIESASEEERKQLNEIHKTLNLTLEELLETQRAGSDTPAPADNVRCKCCKAPISYAELASGGYCEDCS